MVSGTSVNWSGHTVTIAVGVPVFVLVGGKPIRASRRSAQWCLDAVNQCWTQKAAKIRASEIEAARAAYDHAREVYRQRIAEAEDR